MTLPQEVDTNGNGVVSTSWYSQELKIVVVIIMNYELN